MNLRQNQSYKLSEVKYRCELWTNKLKWSLLAVQLEHFIRDDGGNDLLDDIGKM